MRLVYFERGELAEDQLMLIALFRSQSNAGALGLDVTNIDYLVGLSRAFVVGILEPDDQPDITVGEALLLKSGTWTSKVSCG